MCQFLFRLSKNSPFSATAVIDCFSQVLCLQGLPTGFGSQGSFACYLVERSSGTSNSALRLLWQKRSPSTYQAFPPSNFHLNIPGCCVLLNGRLHPCAESLSPSIYLPMGGEFVRDSGGGWFPLFNSWVPCPNSPYPLFFGLLPRVNWEFPECMSESVV